MNFCITLNIRFLMSYDLPIVFTHELAHRIDRFFIHAKNLDDFQNGLLEAEITFDTNPFFFIQFCAENKSNRFLSDIMSAICGGKYFIPGGHNAGYWNLETRASECFANLFSLKALGNEEILLFVKKIFPVLIKSFEDIDF